MTARFFEDANQVLITYLTFLGDVGVDRMTERRQVSSQQAKAIWNPKGCQIVRPLRRFWRAVSRVALARALARRLFLYTPARKNAP